MTHLEELKAKLKDVEKRLQKQIDIKPRPIHGIETIPSMIIQELIRQAAELKRLIQEEQEKE